MGQHILHDEEIREPLFEFLEERFGIVRILEEKMMGSSRADVIMVTPDTLYGIEIKSDADSYQRLASQVKDYDQYYDKNLVVVGTTHAMHIEEHVPAHWGIITVEELDGAADFYMLRRPSPNPEVCWKKKLEILWRPELSVIQERFGMAKYKEKNKAFVLGKIAERIPDRIDESELSHLVCHLLLERDYTRIEETLSEYRKGVYEKKLEAEEDPTRQIQLMMEQADYRNRLKKRTSKRRRRR